MKKLIVLLVCLTVSNGMYAQSVIGAWEGYATLQDGEPVKRVVIFTDGYQVLAEYNATTGAFISTNGGTWKLDGNVMTEKVEFNSASPESVGQEVSFQVEITNTTLKITGMDGELKRLDNGTPGALQNAWLMSGRKRDGEIQSRDTSRPRKTMKMLSGTRFQWIAYNTETKQFMGTGGGTYTTVNGEYTENIEFFSKDVSRVGASLKFNYELIEGAWHHSGLSSKGAPIYEIWSVRE